MPLQEGLEILREIQDWKAWQRNQFGQRVGCHVGLALNPTEITNTKLRSYSS